MSEIDGFRHECIAMVSCPSSFLPSSFWRHPERVIPLYRLEEDALDADTFRAKKGDMLLGGGSGGCTALRVSIPETFYLLMHDNWDEWNTHEDIYYAYWSMNDAFVFGDGYFRLGWDPSEDLIEVWLVEHILAFLLREFPETYGPFQGSSPLVRDGSICRLPTAEEKAAL